MVWLAKVQARVSISTRGRELVSPTLLEYELSTDDEEVSGEALRLVLIKHIHAYYRSYQHNFSHPRSEPITIDVSLVRCEITRSKTCPPTLALPILSALPNPT